MKILIISTTDLQGGAGRAAHRLYKSLLEAGVESWMLVQKKSSDDFAVISLSDTKFEQGINLLRPTLDKIPANFYKNKTNTLFSSALIGFSKVINKINEINPDIVHLHWVCGGMLRIEDLKKIKKPIVWSLHDNWVFSGGCHIKWDCEGYRQSCGACPRLGSKKEKDLSRWIWNRKEKTFSNIKNMTIVGLSRWITRDSQRSSLLKDKEHFCLPNPIDTNIFKPFDKVKSKELWNLPKDKKLILFGAINAMSDINKGFKELSKALQKLNQDNIELVIFGSSKPQNALDFKIKTHYMGHLHDDISLIALYNAVDVLVVPSLQENLSNVIMESLSCATPIVAFDIGGNSDMIEHKKNGYLAKPYESMDLANGIEWVLNNENYEELCKNAREKVLKEFDSKVVVKKYIALYEKLMKKDKV